MFRGFLLWVVVGLSGCARVSWLPPYPETSDPTWAGDCPPEGTTLTWNNFGEPFFTTWCTNCHSTEMVPGEDGDLGRQGAPVGFDYDSYAGIAGHVAPILAVATGDSPRMPPSGGPSAEERANLEEWLLCGLPGGTEEPVAACAVDRPLDGSLTLTTAADVDAFCAGNTGTTGDVVVAASVPIAVDCLCTVGGDLVIETAPSVSLPNLVAVDGGISAKDAGDLASLDLPELMTVGGDYTVAGNPTLGVLETEQLESIGGSLRIEGNPLLGRVWIPRTDVVGGDLIVRDNASVATLNLSQLQTVGLEDGSAPEGGSLIVDGNTALTDLPGGAYEMSAINGDLVLSNNPSLSDIYNLFVELEDLGGSLEVVNNDRSTLFFSFTRLASVGGHLWISDNASLQTVDGFDHLASVGGEVRFHGNTALISIGAFRVLADVAGAVSVVDSPALRDPSGLYSVVNVGGLEIRNTGLLELDGFDAVQSITGGGLVVSGNPNLGYLELLGSVQFQSGDIVITDNAVLGDLYGWLGLTQLAGDVVLADNPALDTAVICPSLGSLGGGFTAERTGLQTMLGVLSVNGMDGDLVLRENPSLVTLTGVDGLVGIGGDLVLDANPVLTDVTSLYGLGSVGADFTVTDNVALPTSAAEALRDQVGSIGGTVSIWGNGP